MRYIHQGDIWIATDDNGFTLEDTQLERLIARVEEALEEKGDG